MGNFAAFEQKMSAAGMGDTAIRAFRSAASEGDKPAIQIDLDNLPPPGVTVTLIVNEVVAASVTLTAPSATGAPPASTPPPPGGGGSTSGLYFSFPLGTPDATGHH